MMIYAEKSKYRELDRSFFNLNDIRDGIMRKDTERKKFPELEIERNKCISKKKYIRASSE